jgi:hypothetical protein
LIENNAATKRHFQPKRKLMRSSAETRPLLANFLIHKDLPFEKKYHLFLCVLFLGCLCDTMMAISFVVENWKLDWAI